MSRLRRFFKSCLVGLMAVVLLQAIGCGPAKVSGQPLRLTVGLVSYDDGASSLERYQRFQTYLAEQLKAIVELEPVFNEIRAVEQIRDANWSLVFAPSGLAAIAIAEANYLPIFPMLGAPNQKSVLVVRNDSPFQALGDLANQTLVLGEPGSATGYYLPLYDLYGLTLKAIEFASTPATALEWVANGRVAAGAMSEDAFQQQRSAFDGNIFRILHASRAIPPGAVLISPNIDRNQQQYLEQAMQNAPSTITADAGYVPNTPPPDLSQLIALVNKVRPLESRIKEQPVVLTLGS
ncbi:MULTISPECIES: PhnD/SsuA/transferrin family substrate-binding protein [Cyanophyceae]|uniref:phosphate/phosphite/phosphonate ABC transporter substrate-binding protein n=1 Tax=Cyanophyceae TaxID=3028117 RepID=UPI001683103F|nr:MULTISPECIES: PhnD/SsuA/transferrin family substrate-binding protein [Cyanophyceae]MBD1914354.1 PhnD/SsuA/transferrin family substrate-binding protein [Phormidium sp. FACHB-77]MBD2028662.1 PhnD/SsuA/transferrin family substrate-binding protein [Phormidium sp. FACHB-322]MBD2053644.1 PhnD/SsuA/transferrin family substrate-binding protein [Leptolyngbya sp. FACHB-60]